MSADVVREVGLEATMADGVRLVADVWRPAAGGPWPTLLQRLPYGRSVASSIVLPHPSWFARRGYAVVVQDVRGTGESEGEFVPFLHEAEDGAASVEWAAGLPWSHGKVGMYGFSYQGLCQLYAAARRPPSLRAIAPIMCAPDPYEGWTYEGGCLRWAFAVTWGAQLVGIATRGAGALVPDLGAIPLTTALGPQPPRWFLEWLEHPEDDDYWAARRPDLDAIEVPVFTIVGWFDDFSAANARLAQRLRAEAVFGPWAHVPWGTRFDGVELGTAASPLSAFDALTSFFDRHLTADRKGPAADPIRYFMGGVGWRTSSAWPPTERTERWTATSGGNANSRHGDGLLVLGPAEPGPPDVLVSEPLAPHPAESAPLQNVATFEDRRDVLCYTSEALPIALDVAGSAAISVLASCDCETFDLVASLVLVEADGSSHVLAYGARRLEGAAGSELAATVDLRPIAWHCPSGSRLRLDLAPSRFPVLAPNPHLRPDAAFTERGNYRVATIALLAAHLDLPVE